ncbi:hypothetical protein MNBD_GAMMA05-1297 [hydrothermal vent metagenome]|uniref:Peptidase M10 metallopeptidase domain-containing protein n=1 Tax=hydrothermal vent metagenome TaxID=652676 RepID=A0A3B0WVL4_9ZZZZ
MNAKYLVLVFSLLNSGVVFSGTYIFASEANGVNIVTHPSTYTGTEDIVTIRVCIDPTSPNATNMEYSVQKNIAQYNQLTPTVGNVFFNANNNIPSAAIDFESVALHEIGHCLGMAHVNAASESGQTGIQQNYTKATDGVDNMLNLNAGVDGVIGSSDDVRGDDVNLHWFRTSNNDPFTIDSVVDSTTYSVNLADLPAGHNFAANADRDVSILLGYPETEAVMQQGTLNDEAQRTLGHDDVATLRYAASGLNELENDPGNPNQTDNYSIVLEYGGISTTNCDISMAMTNTASLAFCGVSGVGLSATHVRIGTASIEFGDSYNWFFNSNAAPVLNAIGDINVTEGDNVQIIVSASDVDNNVLSFSDSGTPAFVTFVDNNDDTATITLSPALGDATSVMMTVTVADDETPALTDDETFTIYVAELDSDGDGLGDYDEINIYLTNPNLADTDGDFISDGVEINNGVDPSDPLDPLDWPNFADGDLAPLGFSDGQINAADYLIAQRIALGELTATSLELAHGDLYPVGSPDGKIDASDLVLLLQLVQ